jgi:hypothetical protein
MCVAYSVLQLRCSEVCLSDKVLLDGVGSVLHVATDTDQHVFVELLVVIEEVLYELMKVVRFARVVLCYDDQLGKVVEEVTKLSVGDGLVLTLNVGKHAVQEVWWQLVEAVAHVKVQFSQTHHLSTRLYELALSL